MARQGHSLILGAALLVVGVGVAWIGYKQFVS